jgi:prepilin-type N-terminal cleavage/methylation domain-containing protein
MKITNYNRSGFTLVESMIAMVVLAIAASGVLLPFSSAAAVHVEGSRRTLAAKLAADLLEEISTYSYSDIMGTWDGFSESQGNVTKVLSDEIYTGEAYRPYSRQVDCLSATIGDDRDTTLLGAWVTVTVSYDGKEMAKLKTLISD